MPREALKTTLQELQLELEKLNFENQAHRSEVDRSVAELEKKLRDESFMSGDEYLIHELRESLQSFEEHHPRLTELIGHMSDLLAKLGI